MEFLLVERAERIATVTLNRPAARNALSSQLQAEIAAAFGDLGGDRDVRAIVLTGRGDRAFCAGLDLKELRQGVDLIGSIGAHTDPIEAIRRCPKPVIAAVNGAAVTGGLELALVCDVIFGAENAVLADTHAKIRVVPGWGLSHRLARRIGPGRAMEMSLSARAIDAATALRWGLLDRVFPRERLLAEAQALAADIAQWDADMVQRYKALIHDNLGRADEDAAGREAAAAVAYNSVLDPAAVGQRGAIQDHPQA
ncbi:MAG: enoyl-CoA hydratase [Pseudomonadota bacterium]